MTIQDLLAEPGQEDKFVNLMTTSFKFKEDVWNYFNFPEFKDKICCEFGTHKGQTTRILSFLFQKVYTINQPDPGRFDKAMDLNADRTNIEYIGFDLYCGLPIPISSKVDVFFVDANHEYNQVLDDIEKIKNMSDDGTLIIFDDYGRAIGVNVAITDSVESGELTILTQIGHKPGHSFGGTPERILKDWEGVICRLNKNT